MTPFNTKYSDSEEEEAETRYEDMGFIRNENGYEERHRAKGAFEVRKISRETE